MIQNFLFSATFHSLLIAIDQEFIEKMKETGCSCGGRLHQADYPRSPFGMPPSLRSFYETRFSLCCDTCRKRITPQSVRFFGRRWYPAPLFILISALMLGINERRLKQVRRHLGIVVSESTWKRWRRWFRQTFEETKFWKQGKGFAIRAIETAKLFPRALFALFSGTFEEKVCFLLQFLSPLTGGILRAV